MVIVAEESSLLFSFSSKLYTLVIIASLIPSHPIFPPLESFSPPENCTVFQTAIIVSLHFPFLSYSSNFHCTFRLLGNIVILIPFLDLSRTTIRSFLFLYCFLFSKFCLPYCLVICSSHSFYTCRLAFFGHFSLVKTFLTINQPACTHAPTYLACTSHSTAL